MPKMTSFLKLIALPLALGLCAGCSGSHDTASALVDASGNHPANWVQQHWMAYKSANGGSSAVSSSTGCSECHGSDLAGGISKVSCFGASFNGMNCHANDDHTLGHPAAWGDPTSTAFHGVAAKGSTTLASTASCGMCHATDADVSLVGSAPSCLSTDPKWGISCHASSPAANSTGCVSCHSTPPAGATLPNRAGAHAAHLALTGVTCSTCHTGYGSGTEKHATALFVNGATAFLKLDTKYDAKTAGFSYTTGKCSGVSCHGGRQTPAWTGSLEVSTGCLSCHEQGYAAQTPQYNSFYSGTNANGNMHQYHLTQTNRFTGAQVFCSDCHNLTTLAAQHFTALNTVAFEGVASDTIGGGSTRISLYTAGTQTCTNSCHVAAPATAHWNQ